MAKINRLTTIALVAAATVVAASPSARAADPTTVDCLSATEASLKLKRELHFREARQQLLVCAALTCPVDIRVECERRLTAVNTAIPTLVFEARDAAGNDLSAVSVAMDGKPLVDRLEGTAMSLDPGAHSFHFETAGAAPIDKSFVLREGEKDRRERVVFGAPSPASSQAAPPKAPGTASEPKVPAPASAGAGMSTLRTLGLVSGGLGLAGLGVGAAFGVMAGSASRDQQNACPSTTNCPNRAQAASDHTAFGTDTGIEIAGFVAGGALLAAGVVMFIVGGNNAVTEGSKTALLLLPSISQDGVGISLHGGF